MMKKIFTLFIFIMLIMLLCGCNEQIVNIDSDEDNTDKGDDINFDLPVIENIGIDLDFYNETTKKAGDFQFDTFICPWGEDNSYDKIFYDYGESSINDNGSIKWEPQPIFIVPLGTKVHAITDGKVSSISTLYSGDYTIHIIKEDNPKWTYEHEHVINVTVEVGDMVTAGQEIAEVSDYNHWCTNDGYGVFDIGILTTDEKGNPWHHCPFMYLNESVKQEFFDKINNLYESWEVYFGNSELYTEEENAIPGCIICDPING